MPGSSGRSMLDEYVHEALVCQFHDNNQLSVDQFDALHRQQERMAKRLDVLNGLQFFDSRHSVAEQEAAFALDKLDGLVQTSGSLTLPDLSETTTPQWFDQPIARYRFPIVALWFAASVSLDRIGWNIEPCGLPHILHQKKSTS